MLKILNVGFTTSLVLVIAVAAFLGISARRSRDAVPTIAGHKILMVLSGSMYPAIHTGDVIIVRPLRQEETIRQDDIITFRGRENASMLITHRVVGVLSVNGKPAAYTTKGDANPTVDSEMVNGNQIIGIYRWRVPYFGYVANFIHTPAGIILCVILPGLLIIGQEVRRVWKLASENEEDQASGGDREAK